MRARALNLRSDLKKLSEAELGIRLEECWRAYDEAKTSAAPHKLIRSWRGPIRHPMAYPISSIVGYSGPFYLRFGLALGLTSLVMIYDRFRGLMNMHLALCEARDLLDEIERRLAGRQLSK